MRSKTDVGILGYGAYIPMYRIKNSEIATMWNRDPKRTPVIEKATNGPDEDVITMGCEAARNAILRAKINPKMLQTLYLGTESKPYAVKPSATVIAEAIGATGELLSADYEFACKAGTETFQACIGLVGSEMVEHAMGIGVDTAQGRPQDALEFTAASGGGAYIFSKKSNQTLAYIEGSCSFVTDTPDFWRRQHEIYPSHGGRFTGKPAYFRHVIGAAKMLFEKGGYKKDDFDYACFHQPNKKFPMSAAKILGFSNDQIKHGLLSPYVGNTYAGAVPLGLTNILDNVEAGARILVVSYGSGAGSDAFSIVTQDALKERRDLAPMTQNYLDKKRYIDYATYARFRNKIRAE